MYILRIHSSMINIHHIKEDIRDKIIITNDCRKWVKLSLGPGPDLVLRLPAVDLCGFVPCNILSSKTLV